MPVLLRALRRPVPDAPAALVNLVELGEWGWQITVAGSAEPDGISRVGLFTDGHTRAWPMPSQVQLRRLALRLEVLPVCAELRRLLLGGTANPVSVGGAISAAQAFVELLKAEVVLLRTEHGVLSSWEGDTSDSQLVSIGQARLRWSWDGLTYEDANCSYLVNGWSDQVFDVVLSGHRQLGLLPELTRSIAPGSSVAQVEWLPYSTVALGWLDAIYEAALFAGSDGVLGIV